jgi:hypothetical protein
VHAALNGDETGLLGWYDKGYRRRGSLVDRFTDAVPAKMAIKAPELYSLGLAMAEQYQAHYGLDPTIDVIGAEIPLQFSFSPKVVHLLKPDVLFRYRGEDKHAFWLMETKTATSIETQHLTIDDQARPYGAMAETALRNAGVLGTQDYIAGIMYNFLRKKEEDDRPQNEKGQRLNRDGSVSKKQPAPLFQRHKVLMTSRAKAITLKRLAREVMEVAALTDAVRNGPRNREELRKTPTKECPRFCDFFAICEADEQGADIRQMKKSLFVKADPYAQYG